MNTYEEAPAVVQDGVIELGIARVETKGEPGLTNEAVFHRIMPDISED
jgi:hypothetical protein